MKRNLFLGLVFFSLMACKKSAVEEPPITGMWVEATHKNDTLVFDGQGSMFNLNRGIEVRNGSVLPKYLSGPYSYSIEKDSVYLKWAASSIWTGNNYYFNVDSRKQEIRIGNFFVDSLNNKVILTFSRLK